MNRPIHRRHVVKRCIPNIPEEEPLTPRLRKKDNKTEAIGFLAGDNHDELAEDEL